jgi:hypothetical protein
LFARCLPVARLAGAIILLAGLNACFVQHPNLIGMPEAVAPGQWSGTWVAAPLSDHDEPGYFQVSDVDPAQGIFEVRDADAGGNSTGAPMELRLRRVGGQLFFDVRDKPDRRWMLFVVDESMPDSISLAWKPSASAFEKSIALGDFKATLKKDADDVVEEVAFADLTPAEADSLAVRWRDLFLGQRIKLERVVHAN